MRPRIKTITLVISLLLNGLVFLFTVLALSRHTASFSFYDMGGTDHAAYTTAAAVVSFPRGGNVLLGPVEITLKRGQSASLQFSAVSQNRQANYLITALYDRGVLKVDQNGFGIVITALEAGETTMQTLSDGGITDIARVRVSGE